MTTDQIIDTICKIAKLPKEEVVSKTRFQEFVRTRFVIMKELKVRNHLAFTAIARELGKADHATIISGIAKYKDLMVTDPDFKAFSTECRKQLDFMEKQSFLVSHTPVLCRPMKCELSKKFPKHKPFYRPTATAQAQRMAFVMQEEGN